MGAPSKRGKRGIKIDSAELSAWLERGDSPRFVLVVGEEALLRDRALAQLLEHFVDPGLADFNLDRFSGDTIDVDRVLSACATLPMMADRRVVLVRSLQTLHNARRHRLLEGLADAPPTTLVLIETVALTPKEKELAHGLERALFVSADSPGPGDALRAIKRDLARREIKIDDKAAEALLACRGKNLTGLAIEIEKLAHYVGERRRIEKADVVAVVPAAEGANVFELVDAMAFSDLDTALDMLDRLYAAGEDPLAVVGAATWHFLTLWKTVLDGRGRTKFLRQAPRFDLNRLHFVLKELLSADLDLKSTGGGIEARRSRGRELVLRICAGGGAHRSRRPAKGGRR